MPSQTLTPGHSSASLRQLLLQPIWPYFILLLQSGSSWDWGLVFSISAWNLVQLIFVKWMYSYPNLMTIECQGWKGFQNLVQVLPLQMGKQRSTQSVSPRPHSNSVTSWLETLLSWIPVFPIPILPCLARLASAWYNGYNHCTYVVNVHKRSHWGTKMIKWGHLPLRCLEPTLGDKQGT